jgi:chorismate synthase
VPEQLGGESLHLRFLTAGESHGPGLTAILEGMPAGLRLDDAAIDAQLRRRQGGHGRGGRMKIERDRATVSAGVRHGLTLGSPIAVSIPNRDFQHWETIMGPFTQPETPARRVVHTPRPGHADLAGGAKHRFTDLRDVLERASARETAARVAVGAIARQLLERFGVQVSGHTLRIGEVALPEELLEELAVEDIAARSAANDLACVDDATYQRAVRAIDAARQAGDTLGGIVEVVVIGLPPGLGSHVHWDRKLDGRLAQAACSIPAVKGMEIGAAFQNASLPGSQVHDPILRGAARGWSRPRNRAGGLEGGITNGEPLRLRAAMKPLATLMKPLPSIDIQTGQEANATVERSDVCAVPACGVVLEAMVSLVLADAWLEKFGSDSLTDIESNVERYRQEVARWALSS